MLPATRLSFILLTLCLTAGPLYAANPSKLPAAAIASAHPLATAAGHEILAAGGNAFDAAVAVTAALAVVEPMSSGLGGGGFWLLHRAKDGFETMIDGREVAPNKAHSKLYQDKDGNVIQDASINGPLSAGIPGTVAGMTHLAEKYGRLPLKQLLAPAIKLAKQGFTTSQSYQRMASFRLKALQNSPAAAAIFLKNNAAPEPGTNIVQKDLASTLQKIAQQGNAGFYSGQTASQLVNGSNAAGGIWQLSDLSQYQVKERQPIQGNYRGLRITSAPPPSSGGIAMLTILNILEGFELAPQSDSLKTHLIIESMRRAYRDRAIYLGDPDFNNIPTDMLTDKHYAAGLRASMREDRATQSDNLPGIELPEQARDTTHFSIVDNQGNRVAATLSINYPFGSCFVAPGTGVLLNDEMDDFVAKPGIPNAYGLVGAQANAIEAGKRPLSSMSPTFIDSDQGFAVIGTPGGSRIITMVLLGLLNYQQGKDAMEIVSAPRFHHQFLPDTVFYEEKAFSDTTIAELERMGHVLKQAQFPYGNMQVVIWSNITKKLTAASDPRGIGAAIVK